MNVTISRLKKYAECANACYALFDKEEFTKAYIDVEKIKKMIITLKVYDILQNLKN